MIGNALAPLRSSGIGRIVIEVVRPFMPSSMTRALPPKPGRQHIRPAVLKGMARPGAGLKPQVSESPKQRMVFISPFSPLPQMEWKLTPSSGPALRSAP